MAGDFEMKTVCAAISLMQKESGQEGEDTTAKDRQNGVNTELGGGICPHPGYLYYYC